MRYPVVVSLPAWDGAPGYNTVFVQELASRGFIVAAVGYDDPACAGVDRSAGNAPTGIDFSSQAAFEHTVDVAHQKIQRVAEAMSHVIDAMEALDRVDPAGRFMGRLDLDRIGVVGYSLGGAIAMHLCWRDDRLKAAVNIDGWMFDAAPGGWIEQPLMIISDDTPMATPADLSSPDPELHYRAVLNEADDRRMASEFAKHRGVYLEVVGSEHGDFNDMVYLRRRALLLGPKNNGAAIRTAADYSAAFFGQILERRGIPAVFQSAPRRAVADVGSSPTPGECEVTLTADSAENDPYSIGDRRRALARLILKAKRNAMSPELLSDPEGQFPLHYNQSTFMFPSWPIGPSASAITQPDRPRGPLAEIRRLLLVQRFSRRDGPLG